MELPLSFPLLLKSLFHYLINAFMVLSQYVYISPMRWKTNSCNLFLQIKYWSPGLSRASGVWSEKWMSNDRHHELSLERTCLVLLWSSTSMSEPWPKPRSLDMSHALTHRALSVHSEQGSYCFALIYLIYNFWHDIWFPEIKQQLIIMRQH